VSPRTAALGAAFGAVASATVGQSAKVAAQRFRSARQAAIISVVNIVPQRPRMGATHLLRTLFAGLLATAVLASALPATLARADDEVSIPDAALKSCISAALTADHLPVDFTAANLGNLASISCDRDRDGVIRSLAGLELFAESKLTSLDVSHHHINSLLPLTGLNLSVLDANHNHIASVAGLEGLNATASIDLSYNFIKDFGPLPDDLTPTIDHQLVGYNNIKRGQSFDFGLRTITGEAICPTITPVAECHNGIATFTTIGRYALETPNNFKSGIYIDPDQITPTDQWLGGSVRVGGFLSSGWVSGWNPEPTSWQLDWYRDGRLVQRDTPAGSAIPRYYVTAVDLGHQLVLCRTGYLDGYSAVRVCSNPSRVEPGLLENTRRPRLIGTSKVGRTLRVDPGQWPAGVTIKYQWRLNDRPLKKVTSNKLKLKKSYRTEWIQVVVIVSKPGYSTVRLDTQAMRVRR